MKADAWKGTVRELDLAIRSGKGAEIRHRVEKLARRRVPREHAADVARLSWRVSAPSVGIRVLRPIVRPNRRVPCVPTPEETAEYAQCLIRIGAIAEATDLLRGIAASDLPRAWLYEASAHMTRFDYAAAYPLAVRYARAPGIEPYDRLVGKINVAACLVCLRRHLEAEALLRELLHELSLKRLYLLHGNALELAGQNFALRGKWREVDECLDRAEATLAAAGTGDGLYLRKWRAISQLIRTNADPASVERLRAVRSEAVEALDWWTVRQCDEFEATYRRDERLVTHLYYGTPHEAFRKRLIDDYGRIDLPGEYVWRVVGEDGGVLDLSTGEWNGKRGCLRPGQLLLRLMAVLCSDYYRPLRPAEVHHSLYPGEWYHPETSPFRVYEAMKRLRRALAADGIPLTIAWRDGAYQVEARGSCAIRFQRAARLERWAEALGVIRGRWAAAPFTVGQASQQLGLNPRTVLRWLEDAREVGAVTRVGRGRGLKFVIAAPAVG